MAISIGDKLPDAKFYHMGENGPEETSTAQVFNGKKVVLFAVPGAFTPTCSNNHLPGFIEHEAAIKDKGVDEIAVVACNDAFVMDAWASISGGEGKIHFLADPNAEFAKALGMDLDLTARGLGMRSRRYAMIVEDGKVTMLGVDEVPSDANASSASKVLEAL
jgi:peroxiredoxin